MDRQEGPLIECVAGARRPRTGSCRKPRSGPHPFVTTVYADALSPLASSPSSCSSHGKATHEENGHLSVHALGDWQEQANGLNGSISPFGHGTSQGKDNGNLLQSDGGGEMIKDSKGLSSLHRMGEGEGKNEWKIFQRREKRRDECLPERDPNGSVRKIRMDSDDVSEKDLSREEPKYDGSPEYERMKKLEKIWKEKPPSQKSYKDLGYQAKGDHSSKHSGQFAKEDHSSKDSGYRDRGDHSSQNWSHRDRGHHSSKDGGYRDRNDLSYDEYHYRDKGSRDYFREKDPLRDRDHQKFRRVSDERERHAKLKDGQDWRESLGKCHSQSQNRTGHSPGGYERKGSQMPSDHVSEKSLLDNRPPTKLKLKVGGITHTIHSDGGRQSDFSRLNDGERKRLPEGTGSSFKKPALAAPEASKRRQRLILQDNSDDEDDGFNPRTREQVQEASGKDACVSNLTNIQSSCEADDGLKDENVSRVYGSVMSKPLEAMDSTSQRMQAVRKSTRVPKKRIFDGDEDVEPEPKRRRRKKIENESEDEQYHVEEDEEENDIVGDDDVESITEFQAPRKRQRRKKVESDSPEVDGKRGIPLTARQRALKSSKEGGDSDLGASLIEFPEGLTHSFPKKQKENLTEAEQAVKKEEAAKKRRQQVEKTAKEIQAVAIQKILCQDSTRKKREVKLQKQRKELEEEKQAAAMIPAINSIRWVMGPSGNVVSFSQDLELPNIFSGPCSYPQERERCAAPSCNNAYKYRDSKTRLPLCSLQCYRAVRKPTEVAPAF